MQGRAVSPTPHIPGIIQDLGENVTSAKASSFKVTEADKLSFKELC